MKNKFEFECNISEEYKDNDYIDEWGSAFVWYGDDMGVEYNFCIDGDTNSSAIYKTEINKKTGYMETDYSEFVHYEVDFNDAEWRNKLEEAMCNALIKLHGLCIK